MRQGGGGFCERREKKEKNPKRCWEGAGAVPTEGGSYLTWEAKETLSGITSWTHFYSLVSFTSPGYRFFGLDVGFLLEVLHLLVLSLDLFWCHHLVFKLNIAWF